MPRCKSKFNLKKLQTWADADWNMVPVLVRDHTLLLFLLYAERQKGQGIECIIAVLRMHESNHSSLVYTERENFHSGCCHGYESYLWSNLA